MLRATFKNADSKNAKYEIRQRKSDEMWGFEIVGFKRWSDHSLRNPNRKIQRTIASRASALGSNFIVVLNSTLLFFNLVFQHLFFNTCFSTKGPVFQSIDSDKNGKQSNSDKLKVTVTYLEGNSDIFEVTVTYLERGFFRFWRKKCKLYMLVEFPRYDIAVRFDAQS